MPSYRSAALKSSHNRSTDRIVSRAFKIVVCKEANMKGLNRRDVVFHGVVALSLIVGVVGGNFALHRWMLGNTTSREADAGTVSQTSATDINADDDADLFDLKPTRRNEPAKATNTDSTARREFLKKLIATKLPEASEEDQAAWLEKLEEVPLETAEGILDLRGELGSLSTLPKAETKPSSPIAD